MFLQAQPDFNALRDEARLMLPAYRATQFDTANRIAQRIVNVAKLPNAPPEIKGLAHHALTIQGLIEVQRKNPKRAAEFLLLAARADGRKGQPSFALAEALLKLGDRATVLQYLEICSSSPNWELSKSRIDNFLNALKSGALTSFGEYATM